MATKPPTSSYLHVWKAPHFSHGKVIRITSAFGGPTWVAPSWDPAAPKGGSVEVPLDRWTVSFHGNSNLEMDENWGSPILGDLPILGPVDGWIIP